MDQTETVYNLTEQENGEWTLNGVWVIDDFPNVAHTAKSQKFPISDDIQMYLTFLNPLNRTSTRTTMTVFFTALKCEYPMELTAILLNSKGHKQSRTTHVVYSSSALRSYLDFPNARWVDLTEPNGYVERGTGRLRIEFRFRHKREPFNFPPEALGSLSPKTPVNVRPPSENPRDIFGVVGIQNIGGDDCLNSLILALYNIPAFREILYSINTRGMEGAGNAIYAFQRLFCDVQMKDEAPDSKDFVRCLHWASDHFAPCVCREALAALMDPVREVLKGDKRARFESMFLSKWVQTSQGRNTAKDSIETYDIEIEAVGSGTFVSMMDSFIAKIQSKSVDSEVVDLPDVLFVTLHRFIADTTGGFLVKNAVDLQIPSEFNFNKLCGTTDLVDELWDLQAVVVQSGRPESGTFYVNIRENQHEDNWLEYRSYQVTRVPRERAINGTDAVMLMYTRRSCVDKLFNVKTAIPKHIMNPSVYTAPFQVTVMTEHDMEAANLRGEVGCGIIGSFVVPAHVEDSLDVFKDVLASYMETDKNRLRLWGVTPNGTFAGLLSMKDKCSTIAATPFVFAETVPKGQEIDMGMDERMIVMKFFSTDAPCPLQFLGISVVKSSQIVSSMFARVCEILGVQEDTPFLAYREDMDYSATRIDVSKTFEQLGIFDTTTIVFQCPPGYANFAPKLQFKNSLPAVKERPVFPHAVLPENVPGDVFDIDITKEEMADFRVTDTVDVYYDMMYHLVYLKLQVIGIDPPQSCTFYFRVPMSMPISKLEQLFAELAGIQPHLLFFMPNGQGTGPSATPVDRIANTSLRNELLKQKDVFNSPVTIFVQEIQ